MRVYHVFLAVLFLLLPLTSELHAMDLYARLDLIETMRLDGDYDKALAQANGMLEEFAATGDVIPWHAGHTRRLAATLERIRDMDPDRRAEITRARLLYNEAYEAHLEGRYREGAAAARESYDIHRRILGEQDNETIDLAFIYADLLQELGELVTADELYAEVYAYAAGELEPDHPLRELLLNNWAFVAEQLGQLDAAITRRRRTLALTIANLGYESEATGTSLNNLGGLLMDVGRFAEAEQQLIAAEEVRRRHGTESEVLQTTHNLGNLYVKMGRLDDAESTYDRAFAFAADAEEISPLDLAAARAGYAGLLLDRREYQTAAEILAEVVEVRRTHLPPGDRRVAYSRIDLGNALARNGRFPEAAIEIDAGLVDLERIHGPGTPEVAAAYWSRADRSWLAGDYQRAVEELRVTADTYETARLSLDAWGSLDAFQTPWFATAACLMLLNQPAEAWRATEAGHGRILADALVSGDRSLMTRSEQTRSLELYDAVNRTRAVLTEFGEGHEEFEVAIRALAESEATLAEFNREVGRGIVKEGGRPLDLARVQSALAVDEAIIGWLQIDETYPSARGWGYVIRSQGQVAWSSPQPMAEAQDTQSAARALRRALRNGGEWEHHAAQVWSERIAPLLPYLEGVSGLIVVPAGDMVGWPVEVARPRGGPDLGERYRVSYAPSAGIFARLREASREHNGITTRVLALGDPPFNKSHGDVGTMMGLALRGADQARAEMVRGSKVRRSAVYGDRTALAGLDRLHHTAAEANAVFALGDSGSLLLVGPECNESRVRELVMDNRLREFDLIHIATHSLIHPFAPQNSCFVLSQLDLASPAEVAIGAPYIDGLITADEVSRHWHLDAELVTLSGCDTGLGRLQRGEGYLGFVNAFLANGARSVLVSLWPVNDHSTALLMQRFYELYLGANDEPMGKAEALAAAKIWLQDYWDEVFQEYPYRDPWYWSGFVLVGSPD